MRTREKQIEKKVQHKFIIEKEQKRVCDPKEIPTNYYDITQNINSLYFMFDSMISPDPKTLYFYEILNCFQMLPDENDYCSYSQSFTTYCLKVLARMGFIEIWTILKKEQDDLIDYKIIADFKYRQKTFVVDMHEVFFRKKKSFQKDDMKTLLARIKSWNINIQNFEIIMIDEIPILKWKKEWMKEKMTNPLTYKKIIRHILTEIYINCYSEPFYILNEMKRTKRIRNKNKI